MSSFKPKSFHLQWHLTERCNLRCEHCYQEEEFIEDELNTEEVVKVLEDFVSQIKAWDLPKEAVRISLTGGEPLVRDDFFEVLKKVSEHKDILNYGVLTNGLTLDDEKISKMEELGVDYLQISVEGMKETNDKIRGEGVFENAIEKVKKLKKTSITPNLSITVTKANFEEIPQVINLTERLEVGLGVRRFVPQGRGEKMKDLMLSPKEVRNLWHYILRNTEKVGIGCEDGMLVQDLDDYRPGNCSAGYLSLTFMPNGDVYPCRRFPIFVGNLKESSFSEIFYESEELKRVRNDNILNKTCKQCPHFKVCRGGAKCLSFGHFKESAAPDPHCWRLFQELPDPEEVWEVEERGKLLNSQWLDFYQRNEE